MSGEAKGEGDPLSSSGTLRGVDGISGAAFGSICSPGSPTAPYRTRRCTGRVRFSFQSMTVLLPGTGLTVDGISCNV